jgi:hypothetical protein
MEKRALDIVRRIPRICLSVGIIGAVTFVYFRVASVNSTTVALTLLLAVLGIVLILAWKNAGYFGIDRYLLPALGTPWRQPKPAEVPAPVPAAAL